MLLNTRSILYLFDLDGTLLGEDHWYSYIKNTTALFKSPLYIDPSSKNIRWSILSGRPRIDYLLIKLACNLNKLYPEKIITQETLLYKSKNLQEVYNWKSRMIKYFMDSNENIQKIYYIDADLDCIKYLNQNKDRYDYLGLTPINFLKEDFKFFQ